jgi:hypothetical protein
MPHISVATARVCHEANREYCEILGDHSQKPWDEAEEWQRRSAVQGALFAINNPDATASDQHEAWFKAKQADGWKYGTVKDPAAKTHPCMVPYDQLPESQRFKDHLFRAIALVFAKYGS